MQPKRRAIPACTVRHVPPSKSALVETTRTGYCAAMAFFLSKVARLVAQRVASDPVAREKVIEGARVVMSEAKQISREDDRAYAAGRAVRRAFDKLQGSR